MKNKELIKKEENKKDKEFETGDNNVTKKGKKKRIKKRGYFFN